MTTKFRLLTEVDTPTVVGKAWWNEALKLTQSASSRRMLVGFAAIAGGALIVPPVCGGLFLAVSGDDGPETAKKPALEMQKLYGWSFGVTGESRSLTFPGALPPDGALRQKLLTLADDLRPVTPAYQTAYVPTLFQALKETSPQGAPTEDRVASAYVPLIDVLPAATTPQMAVAEADARRLKGAFAGRQTGVALVIDLPGPEAVAFASGIADVWEPVFLFDNWPHPRGVVPAHHTLAAAAYHRDHLVQMKSVRQGTPPPAFVLDRNRLLSYVDERTQFDNRSLARLPPPALLKAQGITRVFYVAPSGHTPIESDDVTDDLLAYAVAGIEVRAVHVADLYPATTTDEAAALLSARYGLPQTPPPAPAAATTSSLWHPTPRASPYSAGAGATSRLRPAGFGEVPIVLGASGLVRGALLYQNGSWARAASTRSGSYGRSSSWFSGG